ncbi:hypothetical protein Zmor_014888 [Zophobas morio]|uniref:DUF5641 domain-containing protein n=1 Tax=Zophobas morio TaxID=2755281 RepID=A0AA38MG23_9CUCU|nr:hypothetical protein Zmor_014888 [Zophobas morio]
MVVIQDNTFVKFSILLSEIDSHSNFISNVANHQKRGHLKRRYEDVQRIYSELQMLVVQHKSETIVVPNDTSNTETIKPIIYNIREVLNYIQKISELYKALIEKTIPLCTFSNSCKINNNVPTTDLEKTCQNLKPLKVHKLRSGEPIKIHKTHFNALRKLRFTIGKKSPLDSVISKTPSVISNPSKFPNSTPNEEKNNLFNDCYNSKGVSQINLDKTSNAESSTALDKVKSPPVNSKNCGSLLVCNQFKIRSQYLCESVDSNIKDNTSNVAILDKKKHSENAKPKITSHFSKNPPVLQNTALGLILSGSFAYVKNNTSHHHKISSAQIISRFLEAETVKTGSRSLSRGFKSDLCATSFQYTTTGHSPDGYFMVKHPFSENQPRFTQMHPKWLLSVERKLGHSTVPYFENLPKLGNSPELALQLLLLAEGHNHKRNEGFIVSQRKYLDLVHLKVLKENSSNNSVYLSHNCILNPHISSNKLCEVVDRSNLSSKSLNMNRRSHNEITGKNHLEGEGVYALIVRVKAVLNSRLSKHLSSDRNNLVAFIPGQCLFRPAINGSLRKRPRRRSHQPAIPWHLIHAYHQHFWKSWYLEYLTTLKGRLGWQRPSSNVPGMARWVLVKEEKFPRLQWRLGRGPPTSFWKGSGGVCSVGEVQKIISQSHALSLYLTNDLITNGWNVEARNTARMR